MRNFAFTLLLLGLSAGVSAAEAQAAGPALRAGFGAPQR